MSFSSAQHAALAAVLAGQSAALAALDASRSPAPPKSPREPKAKRQPKPDKPAKPIDPYLALRGTIDAATFLARLRFADQWAATLTVAPNVRADIVRDAQRETIARFTGYKVGSPHGVQLDTARRAAVFAIKPSIGDDRKRSDPSLAGYVQGMPDAQRVRVLDLLARETLAARAIVEHEQAAKDAVSDAAREEVEGLAAFERERIESIRADLASIGAPHAHIADDASAYEPRFTFEDAEPARRPKCALSRF